MFPTILQARTSSGYSVSRPPYGRVGTASEHSSVALANSRPVTTKRALVLAGGGLAGIAWETGILRGIADESPADARKKHTASTARNPHAPPTWVTKTPARTIATVADPR